MNWSFGQCAKFEDLFNIKPRLSADIWSYPASSCDSWTSKYGCTDKRVNPARNQFTCGPWEWLPKYLPVSGIIATVLTLVCRDNISVVPELTSSVASVLAQHLDDLRSWRAHLFSKLFNFKRLAKSAVWAFPRRSKLTDWVPYLGSFVNVFAFPIKLSNTTGSATLWSFYHLPIEILHDNNSKK